MVGRELSKRKEEELEDFTDSYCKLEKTVLEWKKKTTMGNRANFFEMSSWVKQLISTIDKDIQIEGEIC